MRDKLLKAGKHQEYNNNNNNNNNNKKPTTNKQTEKESQFIEKKS